MKWKVFYNQYCVTNVQSQVLQIWKKGSMINKRWIVKNLLSEAMFLLIILTLCLQ